MLVFLAVECPISNRYVPELKRIYTGYAGKGVSFQAVFPDSHINQQRLDQWSKEFAVDFPVELDPLQKLVTKAGATMTPEAAIFLNGRLVYRGRIDDRYVSWGKARNAPTRQDVRETLDALLIGTSVPQRITKSWGCYIEK